MNTDLPDVQNSTDSRNKHINKVGIRNLIVPIKIRDIKGREINTVADISVYCSLTEKLKGVNMSRFAEVVHTAIKTQISTGIVEDILQQIKIKLESDNSYVKIRFNYFVKKEAPVSKKEGYIHIPCILEGRSIDGETRLYLTVETTYLSSCPCSREISDNGSHMQRSTASVTVEMIEHVNIEHLVSMVEKNVCCPIFTILKRPDEKFVTEKAYANSMFVEDCARNVSLALDKMLDSSINDYVVVINHFESIHQHQAVGIINAGRELK